MDTEQSLERVIPPDVTELLKNEKVNNAIKHATELVRGVRNAETIEDQVDVFKHSPISHACKVLDSPEMEMHPAEEQMITALNEKLLAHPQVTELLLGDIGKVGLLYSSIQELLIQADVDETKVVAEMVHYGDVVELSQRFF